MIAPTLLILTVLGSLLIFERDLPTEIVDARYAGPASQFLRTENQDRIHFRDQGESNALPIVLIHGANGSLHQFEMWVELIGGKARIVTLDLPGYGLTGATASARYDLTADLRAIQSVTQHLGINRFVLGGHSMGGGLALTYASQYPEAVSGLLLIDSVVPWQQENEPGAGESSESTRTSTSEKQGPNVHNNPKDSPSKPNTNPLRTLFRIPGIQYFGRHLDPALFAERAARSAYANDLLVTDALIQRYIDLSLRAGSREALFKRLSQRRDTQSRFIHFDGPTLILWGEADAWTPPTLALELKNRLPQATIKWYTNAGHLPMEEAAIDSAKDVLEFIEYLKLNRPLPAVDGPITSTETRTKMVSKIEQSAEVTKAKQRLQTFLRTKNLRVPQEVCVDC